MLITWRLDFADGSFTITQAPPMSRWRIVSRYYEEMKLHLKVVLTTLIQSNAGLSLDDLTVVDQRLLPQMGAYYQAIALQLVPSFNPEHLTPESRYRFFVSGELMTHPDYENPIPGLSGLEQMLGLHHPVKNSKGKKSDVIRITSGDLEIDTLADMMLVFDANALPLRETFPIQFLLPLLEQTQERRRGSEAIKERQQERDRMAFEANEKAIAAEVKRMGGMLPF